MTVAELDEALYLTKGMIQREGLEKVYEVKLTLGEDVFEELKARNVFCDTRERGTSSLYKNTPFEEGEETSVSIVEKKKPKYRPFKNCDELIAHWREMVGYPAKPNTMPLIWVRYKRSESERLFFIESFDLTKSAVKLNEAWYTLEDVYGEMCFLDGTPFGVAE